jgi:hypothetical protein
MSKLLDATRWDRNQFLSAQPEANELVELESFLKKMFVGFDPGFFDKHDIRARMADGWEILTIHHWEEVKEFNKSEARIHQIEVTADGALMFGPNFICIIPHDLRSERMMLQQKRFEERSRASIKAKEPQSTKDAKHESELDSWVEVKTPPKKKG